MYRCKDCGQRFLEPVDKQHYDPRPDGTWEFERLILCPWCGGPDFGEEKEEDDD